ncbi:MAG: ATP-binding protein [Lachnospiraceae bacterium]|nr:ATP-binding protein [Lachnospiraceae bacterium]
MEKLKVEANTDKLDEVLEFLDERLDGNGCNEKAKMQLDIAVEELFVNIAHYAYPDEENGMAEIEISFSDDMVNITLYDSGTPYDPLAKPDPDITLSAEERPIGGLGIYMVKKSMDDVRYRHEDGMNILTISKKIK